MKQIAALASNRRVISWTVLARLVPVQEFLVHRRNLPGNVRKDTTLLEKCQRISVSKRSDKYPGRLYGIDLESLLVLDMSAQGITVGKSTITHTDSGLGLFVA